MKPPWEMTKIPVPTEISNLKESDGLVIVVRPGQVLTLSVRMVLRLPIVILDATPQCLLPKPIRQIWIRSNFRNQVSPSETNKRTWPYAIIVGDLPLQAATELIKTHNFLSNNSQESNLKQASKWEIQPVAISPTTKWRIRNQKRHSIQTRMWSRRKIRMTLRMSQSLRISTQMKISPRFIYQICPILVPTTKDPSRSAVLIRKAPAYKRKKTSQRPQSMKFPTKRSRWWPNLKNSNKKSPAKFAEWVSQGVSIQTSQEYSYRKISNRAKTY